jgi:hypothetical protein
MGWHEFIDDWEATEGGDRHQFVTKVSHVATGTVTIAGTAGEIAAAIGAFDTHHRYRFGIQEKVGVMENT